MTPVPPPAWPHDCAGCQLCPWCDGGLLDPPRVYRVAVLDDGEARAVCAGCDGGGYCHEEARA